MKKSVGIILLFMFISLFGFSSFASSTDTYSTNSVATTTSSASDKVTVMQKTVDSQTQKVTIGQTEKWAEKKGFDIVHLLQKVVQPFAIIIFILSAFSTLFGSFGNSQLVGKGLFGMFISVIMYAVVLYAPEIMDSVMGWLTSA